MNRRIFTAIQLLKTQRFIWLGILLAFGSALMLVVALPRRQTITNTPTTTPKRTPRQFAGARTTSSLPSTTVTPEVLHNVPVEEIQQLHDRDSELLGAIYETARTQPVTALTLAMENAPASPAGDDLITHTAVQWAANEPQAASSWAEKVSDEELRAQLLTGIATVWGESDSLAAAELALRTLPAGRQQDDAVVGIVQRWVQTQPEAAATWVLEFPAGSLRETALENLVKIWAEQDLTQATRWLSELPTGASRDTAVATYVTEIAPSFPVLATQWAQSIGDAKLRDRQLAALAENSALSMN